MGGYFFEKCFSLSLAANGMNDFKAFLPLGDQLRNDLGRILQITIHNHTGIALRIIQRGGDRSLVTEIPAQVKPPDARIRTAYVLKPSGRVIRASVVYADDLREAVQMFQHLCESFEKRPDGVLFIEHGDKNRI